jgi:hypothetical protein
VTRGRTCESNRHPSFTLVDARPADTSRYRPDGHLAAPYELLSRESNDARRREILSTWFGSDLDHWIKAIFGVAIITITFSIACVITLLFSIEAQAQNTIEKRFEQLDRDGDGRLSKAELQTSPQVQASLRGADTNQDGFLSRDEVRQHFTPKTIPPAVKSAFDGALFRRIEIPGLTDIAEGTNGIALADLNRDGKLDVVATYTEPKRGLSASGHHLRVFVNQGKLRFQPHAIRILDSQLTAAEFGRNPEIPNLVDFNGDGFQVRHLAVHRDRVTGVDRLIAALTSGSVFSGGYDPGAPGRIRWNPEPELSGRLARIMSCGSANGDAYLAVDITPEVPKNGGLFRRVDGSQPRWEWLGEWGHRHVHRGVAWVRGLTAIPDLENPGRELLLCSREVDGVIEVVNPQQDHGAHVEFDLRKHFGGLVGAREGQQVTTIFAYNDMAPAVHPDTGERVHLIGGGVMPALRGESPQAKGAWYLVRHADGRYGTGQVFDPDVNRDESEPTNDPTDSVACSCARRRAERGRGSCSLI